MVQPHADAFADTLRFLFGSPTDQAGIRANSPPGIVTLWEEKKTVIVFPRSPLVYNLSIGRLDCLMECTGDNISLLFRC